jgi:asparagine synthase (glutamine-hydrolysing)
MCGIFGAVSVRGSFSGEHRDRFEQLTDLVAYRGPDARDSVTLDLKGGTGRAGQSFDVYLGHRRLAIIDLSAAGRQPMTDGEGRYIVFNGEIFNYVELRTELQALGHNFRTVTDTEVLLRVYAQYGPQGFDKLNGMWAFAIIDVPARKVVLSRDRFSIKPLYYTWSGDQLFFASEIKQLLPLLGKVELNEEVLAAFLTQSLLDHSEETFFCGIKKLKAKHSLLLDMTRGTQQLHQYWDYGPERNVSLPDAIDEFQALFMDSLRLRLRSDVKVGCLLSGGLDSSSIAVVAEKLCHGNLETYSVVSDDPAYSEEHFIDIVSRSTGAANRKLKFRIDDALDGLDEVACHNDEPFAGFSVVAQYKMLRMIRQETDATVLLSGQGADEILLGYLKFFFLNLGLLLKRGQPGRAIGEAVSSWRKGTAVRQFKFSEARRYIPMFAGTRCSDAVKVSCAPVKVWKADDLRQRQIDDIDRFSVPVLAHYEDRNAMAHSLEVRHPFLDHRLVDLLVNLPTEYKLRNGWTKYVLRASMTELPAEVRWRRDKQGFTTPEETWVRRELRPTIERSFRSSLLSQIGVLDDRRFLEYYQKFLSGTRIAYGDISRVLIAEVWARRVLKATPRQHAFVAAN